MFVILKKDYFSQKAGTTLDIEEPHVKSLLDQGVVEAVKGDPYGPLIPEFFGPGGECDPRNTSAACASPSLHRAALGTGAVENRTE
jgi:hypothetical protein